MNAQTFLNFFANIGRLFQGFAAALGSEEALNGAAGTLTAVGCRMLMPLFAILIVVRCARSLFQSKLEQEVWGSLSLPDGTRLPLNHWENLVGRIRQADVRLKYKTVSRNHAALIRDSKGNWTLHPLNTKNGTLLNGRVMLQPVPLKARDIITFGDVETCFLPSTEEEERQQAANRARPGKEFSPSVTLIMLTLFQLMCTFMLLRITAEEYKLTIVLCFGVLLAMMWGLYVIYRIFHRTGFEIETLAFFLTTFCLIITGAMAPNGLKKQTICVALGLFLFFALSICLRNLEFVKNIRWALAIATMALLAFNLLLGDKLFGAKNWLSIAGMSFQPSEFVKIVFIMVGATTLDRMFDRKNLLYTLGYSCYCVGCLGLMSDFGTALIFFVSLLAITFLRSGDLASVLFMVAAAVSGGYIILQFKSYIFARFAIYRHVWEDPSNLGYQQTRTMSAIANGGLFGKGIGQGWLKNVGASRTDLVFGVISEEMGLIVAVCAVVCIIVLALFAVREASIARSSFYVITACSAAMIFVVQTMLNVFGSTDLLPLTGVTLPFVSVGGSSMMSCWALLAFIKASDTRQNAGLAVRLPKRKKGESDQPMSWREATGFFRVGNLPEETEDDKEATFIRRPVKQEVEQEQQPAVEVLPRDEQKPDVEETVLQRPKRQQSRAQEKEEFPDLESYDADTSDADNWKEYFLRANEWEDEES